MLVFTEFVEYGHKTEEKLRAVQSEIKENVQGNNRDRKETGTQINGLEQKEQIKSQPEHNEETRIQKNEERLRNILLQVGPRLLLSPALHYNSFQTRG